MVSIVCFTRIITLTSGAFSGEARIQVTAKELANTLPCRSTMCELLHATAEEILSIARESSSSAKTYFACDAANKKGTHHMIKHISYCDTVNEKLIACELDSDACVGTNEKVAIAIDISMKKLDPEDASLPKRVMHGLSTDAGGGGTGEGLARDLRNHDRLVPESSFFGVTCCLHGHSLAFKSPVEKHFLLGGVTKRTVSQLLHAAHALEQEFELQDLKAMWLAANNHKHPGKIMQPVLTRCSHAG